MSAIADSMMETVTLPIEQETKFQAGLPYFAGMLTLSAGGVYLAYTGIVAQASFAATATAVSGVAIGLFGAYGILLTTIAYASSKNAAEFRAKIGPALQTSAAAVVTRVVTRVIDSVLDELIARAFGRR